ncbi:MAG: hypothetical protein ACP5UT_18430 [Bryobacteraceae bacterium]
MRQRNRGRIRSDYTEAQRILWIISRLCEGERLSTRRIMDRFEVSAATAWRDLRRVEELGYALARSGAGPASTVHLEKGRLDEARQLQLTRAELEALLLAVQGAMGRGRAPLWLKRLRLKLEILYCASAPEPQVQLWRRIVAARDDGARTVRGNAGAALELARAAVESLWCELDYMALGADEPSVLRVAPREVRDGRVYGLVGGIDRWESLDLERIRQVRVTDERFTPPEPEPGFAADDREIRQEIQRVEQQVLRLIGIIRRLEQGHAVSPVRLAEAFSTTLTTVQRDLALLELAGYSLAWADPEPGRPIYHPTDVGHFRAPSLPLSWQERRGLGAVLTTHLQYEPGGELQRVAARLGPGQDGESLMITVESSARETEGHGPERLWQIVEAIARHQECTVWYQAHRMLLHRLRFRPQRIVFDVPLLVRGILLPEGKKRELQWPAIFAVELHDSPENELAKKSRSQVELTLDEKADR